jgi:arylsulfatase
LINLWFYEAGMYNGLPIDDRAPAEMVGGTARPSLVDKSKSQYIYYPNTAPVPEGDMPSIRGRSYRYMVEATFEKDAEGVLFANGSRFGGHSLYVKDGQLKYVNNFIGLKEQIVVADQELPRGEACIVGVSFELDNVDKKKMESRGMLTIYINDQPAGQQEISTQLGEFSVAGEPFTVGRCAGAPVTADYAGYHPWAFKGGTIKKLIVDVSGESYLDLELEAMAAFKRD